MVVDAVFKACVALGIRPGWRSRTNEPTVGDGRPVPNQQHAALPETDAIVILTDHARTLRYEKDMARGAVIDILGDLRGDLAWKVGSDAGDQRGWDDGARLEHVCRGRRRHAIGRDRALVWGLIEEGELAVLR